MIRMCVLAGLLATGSAMADDDAFFFSPVPRWQADPETEIVCAAIEKECPAHWVAESINTEFGYDELYDVSGNLVGVRTTRSTGCKPLDESLLLGQRRFKLAFHKEGRPDLDDIHAELAGGVDPKKVRIVKRSATNVGLGCH